VGLSRFLFCEPLNLYHFNLFPKGSGSEAILIAFLAAKLDRIKMKQIDEKKLVAYASDQVTCLPYIIFFK